MKIVFATNNAHKLDEIRRILGNRCEIVSLADIGCHEDIPETGDTLEANALQKAQYVYEHYGLSCFADDTGLEVEALDGAPGVHSARYAEGTDHDSEANMAKLLRELEGKDNRRAQFRTVICLIQNGPLRLPHEGGMSSPLSKHSHAYQTANRANYGILKAFREENIGHTTDAERALWDAIKCENLGFKFRKQHIIGDYIADFVCLSVGLIVEVDGEYHRSYDQRITDEQRTQDLNKLGFEVVRFANEEVIENMDGVIQTIKKHLSELQTLKFASQQTSKVSSLGDDSTGTMTVSYSDSSLQVSPSRGDLEGPIFFSGSVSGTIAHSKSGSGGFGYDPLFVPEGYDKSFAELGAEVKNKISHRARAVEKLAEYLHSLEE